MAVFLRAIVMLVVLVGLPSAWVYYGPLPAGAQRFVDRAVEIGKEAFAKDPSTSLDREGVTAARFAFDAEPAAFDSQVAAVSFTSTPKNQRKTASCRSSWNLI